MTMYRQLCVGVETSSLGPVGQQLVGALFVDRGGPVDGAHGGGHSLEHGSIAGGHVFRMIPPGELSKPALDQLRRGVRIDLENLAEIDEDSIVQRRAPN